jgi:hypothetical protein
MRPKPTEKTYLRRFRRTELSIVTVVCATLQLTLGLLLILADKGDVKAVITTTRYINPYCLRVYLEKYAYTWCDQIYVHIKNDVILWVVVHVSTSVIYLYLYLYYSYIYRYWDNDNSSYFLRHGQLIQILNTTDHILIAIRLHRSFLLSTIYSRTLRIMLP